MSNHRYRDEIIEEKIGLNLKRMRKELGLSQANLGNFLGLTFQQIQKYETAENRISLVLAYNLCEILGCELNDFFKGLNSDEA